MKIEIRCKDVPKELIALIYAGVTIIFFVLFQQNATTELQHYFVPILLLIYSILLFVVYAYTHQRIYIENNSIIIEDSVKLFKSSQKRNLEKIEEIKYITVYYRYSTNYLFLFTSSEVGMPFEIDLRRYHKADLKKLINFIRTNYPSIQIENDVTNYVGLTTNTPINKNSTFNHIVKIIFIVTFIVSTAILMGTYLADCSNYGAFHRASPRMYGKTTCPIWFLDPFMWNRSY